MAPEISRHEQIAVLCAQLPALRQLYRGPVGRPKLALLGEAVDAARAGKPLGAHLRRLHLPDLAEPGEHEWQRGALPPRLGTSAPRYIPGLYVCPHDACTRQEYREVGTDLPTCAIFDQAMRFTEVR